MSKLLTSLAVVAILFQQGCGGCGKGYSKGQRVGVVFKYSQKGLICKTWEGTANLGGTRMESDSKGHESLVPNVWNFTVKDEDAVRFNPIISRSLDSGSTLKFTYEQEFIALCNSDDGYFVTNIEVVKP